VVTLGFDIIKELAALTPDIENFFSLQDDYG
jgi:RNAse (barnase) inhibitor barstar